MLRYCGPESELAAHKKQLAAAWIAFFVTAGITYQAPPVLLPALMHEFGTTQYGISWLPAIFQLAKGVSTLPGGFAVHRMGASSCVRWGTLVTVLATLCYPFARSLWLLAVLHGVYGCAYNLSGLAPIIVFATTWFDRQRGLAIGILVTAFSMAGVAFPPLMAWLIGRAGWRVASGACPCIMVLVVFPLVAVLRDGPLAGRAAEKGGQFCGQHGNGRSYESTPAAAFEVEVAEHSGASRIRHVVGRTCLDDPAAPEDASGGAAPAGSRAQHLTFAKSLGLGAVWHLAFLSLYQLYVVIALLNTLILYLETDAGLPLELCGLYSSVVFIFSVAGKLLVGAALDSSYQRVAGLGSCLMLVLGTCLPLELGGPDGLRPTRSHARLLAFTVVYGLGYGSAYTVISSKPAKMFGSMPEFSKLQGFLMLFQVIGGFSGTLLTGKLRAATGSYGVSFGIFVGMSAMGCVHYALLEWGEARARATALAAEFGAGERSTGA